jgi:5-hydroxyisourate hydrolase
MKVSVEVIDCSFGFAAANTHVRLSRRLDSGLRELASGRTDARGSLYDWHGDPLLGGIYQLEFELDGYYAELGIVPFSPRMIVEFRVADPSRDLLISLLVTANSVMVYCVG